MLRRTSAFHERAPDVAIRAELGMPDRLTRMLIEGIVDITVTYTQQLRPGLEVIEERTDQVFFDDEPEEGLAS